MKLINNLLTIACLGLVAAAAATASSTSIEGRLSQVETLLDRFGRDNVFLRLQISDLKHEDGINKQRIGQLVQENKSILAELVDVKKERQVDQEEIKKLKSQVESLRKEFEGAVSDIDDLNRKIQEMESCGCSGGSPATPIEVSTSSPSTNEMTTWPINTETEFISVSSTKGKIRIFKDLGMFAAASPLSSENGIYDLRTRALIRTVGGGFPAAFKHNQLITAPLDGPISIWNVETGELVNKLEGNYTKAIWSIELNKNQSLMLTGGFDKIVRLWDMFELRQVRTFIGHTGTVYSVLFDEARSQVLSGCLDRTIRVWNMNDGSLVRTMNGHSSRVTKLLLDEKTGRLFSASWDFKIKEWDIESGTELRSFTGHSDWIHDLIFSEDGQRLISSSNDKSVIIWDKESGQQINRLNNTNQVFYLALNPLNGQLLSTTYDSKLVFWSIKP